MANILVTGGAGYIGSHACKLLNQAGHRPITVDNLSRGFEESVLWGPFYKMDIHDSRSVAEVIKKESIDMVLHFAAFAYVGESMDQPELYYQNNVSGTLALLRAMKDSGCNRLVFSSTCASYGIAQQLPITEDHPQSPINPYGRSKWMVEQILADYQQAYDFKFCALRYFNAAGADPDLEIGERHDPEPHIIPNAIKAALFGKDFFILGNDYPTPDGTCIRDFVHVSDIAQAHTLAVDAILRDETIDPFYNLSHTKGYSLLEIVEQIEKVSNKKINYQFKARRPGDPPELVGSSEKFRKRFGWTTPNSDIETIIQTGLDWHLKTSQPKK